MAPLQIVVIINTDDPVPLRMMRDSYASIFESLSPGSNVQFANGILDSELPPIGQDHRYDLVVIGGGTYISHSDAPWMKRLDKFEKTLYSECPDQKVVAICLGHQTTAVTLGGNMGYIAEPEVSRIHSMNINAQIRISDIGLDIAADWRDSWQSLLLI